MFGSKVKSKAGNPISIHTSNPSRSKNLAEHPGGVAKSDPLAATGYHRQCNGHISGEIERMRSPPTHRRIDEASHFYHRCKNYREEGPKTGCRRVGSEEQPEFRVKGARGACSCVTSPGIGHVMWTRYGCSVCAACGANRVHQEDASIMSLLQRVDVARKIHCPPGTGIAR